MRFFIIRYAQPGWYYNLADMLNKICFCLAIPRHSHVDIVLRWKFAHLYAVLLVKVISTLNALLMVKVSPLKLTSFTSQSTRTRPTLSNYDCELKYFFPALIHMLWRILMVTLSY